MTALSSSASLTATPLARLKRLPDILIGGPQFMLEQLEGEQDADKHRRRPRGGFSGTVDRNAARWC